MEFGWRPVPVDIEPVSYELMMALGRCFDRGLPDMAGVRISRDSTSVLAFLRGVEAVTANDDLRFEAAALRRAVVEHGEIELVVQR